MTIIQKGEPMSDLISRQAAIDAIKREKVKVFHELYDEAWNDAINGCMEVIGQLPPIQPKRGKWILKSYRWECDQCGCLIRRVNPFKGNEWNYNFCPNCGADMREVNHESN